MTFSWIKNIKLLEFIAFAFQKEIIRIYKRSKYISEMLLLIEMKNANIILSCFQLSLKSLASKRVEISMYLEFG